MALTDTAVSREDLAEALTHMAEHAKRQPHIVGHRKWEDAHAKLDGMLTAWERAK